MGHCRGCGSLLDLTDEQISQAVDELVESTRTDTKALGRRCPLCGHPTTEPVSHRKSVQVALLAALVVLVSALLVAYFWNRATDRQEAARQALEQLRASADVIRYLGAPVTLDGMTGQVKSDETGWQEVRLSMAIRGPRSKGLAEVVGGRSRGRWTFSSIDVLLSQEEKRIDVVAGRVVDLDRSAFVQAHTQTAAVAEIVETVVPAARRSGNYPCISAVARPSRAPRIEECTPPIPMATLAAGPVDRFDLDLRTGKFVLRQTDLLLRDGDLQVPLTRTYTSQFWKGREGAFGANSTHDFDIAPAGTRNPYSYMMILLPDGDFLSCPRISKGSGYADAVYRHSETSSPFYQALTRWDGNGWDTRLADGSRIHFPESYSAKNLAQAAPTEMVDARGNAIHLVRDRQRNLQEIRTPHERWIRLAHDDSGRVVRAEDDTGRSVQYRYSGEGLLLEVRHSNGRARRYTYAGNLLTSVRDQDGRLLVQSWYQDKRVVRQVYANGASYEIRYVMTDSDEYATEATVVLPGGATRSFRTWDSTPEVIKQRS